jgi:two-component system LytT family response regulator
MLTAIIADDKKANIDTLQQLLKMYCPSVMVSATAADTDTAYECINRIRPDLVFLDIEMPSGSGFDLLKRFKSVSFEVIFTTAYDQYAIKAFRENALDYLLKPVEIDALQHAVQKAENQVRLKQAGQNNIPHNQHLTLPFSSKISLPVQDGYLFIDHKDLVRCEGLGSYSHLFMADGKKILVSLRLKECEALLPPSIFFRVHNSHIINLQYISKYVRGRGGYILMQDGAMVDVAASRKDAFLERMKNHTP